MSFDTDFYTHGRQTTFESRSTIHEGNSMGSISRIDDWLVSWNATTKLYPNEITQTARAHQNLDHSSDHHPLTIQLDAKQLGIRIDSEWEVTLHQKPQVTQRLKKKLTEEEKLHTREILEHEVATDIAECAGKIDNLTTPTPEDRESLEIIAHDIHNILKKALAITLREVGEDVTYTGRMRRGKGLRGELIRLGS